MLLQPRAIDLSQMQISDAGVHACVQEKFKWLESNSCQVFGQAQSALQQQQALTQPLAHTMTDMQECLYANDKPTCQIRP